MSEHTEAQPIWERWKHEKPHHWRAFVAYREMGRGGGKRSMQVLITDWKENPDGKKPPTLNVGTLGDWSTQYRWRDRCEAYDNHVIAEGEARREKRRDMIRALWEDREIQILEDWFAKLSDLLRVVQAIEQRTEADEDGNVIHILRSNASEIRVALGAHADLLKLKALILGDPTDINEQRLSGGLSLNDLMKEIEDARRRAERHGRNRGVKAGDTGE